MKLRLYSTLVILFGPIVAPQGCSSAQPESNGPVANRKTSAPDGAVSFSSTNGQVHFRLFTNASPDASRLFNTIEIEAYGETLLKSATDADWKRSKNPSLHNVLINGRGPELAPENGARIVEQASGPEWSYVALDLSVAYRGRLNQFKRAILFVEPDLFILYDHVAASEPVRFQLFLHPPAASHVDPIWTDLRFDSPKAGFRIHAPARRKNVRSWKRIESTTDSILPGSVTMELAPTNQITQLDIVTVFAVYGGGAKHEYAFRLLESNTAVGARIHRDGLPTIAAFRTDPGVESPSIVGFEFKGPIGVDVFRPKKRP